MTIFKNVLAQNILHLIWTIEFHCFCFLKLHNFRIFGLKGNNKSNQTYILILKKKELIPRKLDLLNEDGHPANSYSLGLDFWLVK